MSETLEGIAVFNAERTIVDSVFVNALNDVASLGYNRDLWNPRERTSIKEQREIFLGWLANRTLTEIDPLLDVTADRTGERLAPWAQLVIGKEAAIGNTICLYSSTMPEPLLEAYADGIETILPTAQVEYVMGKPLLRDRNSHFTGRVGQMLKATSLEELEEEGCTIEFVADSFSHAWPAIRMGKRRLIVNPDTDMYDRFHSRTPVLYWREGAPTDIETRVPYDEYARFYDLTDRDDIADFLDEMGYDNPQ
jgi:hypothetical protein